MARSEPGKPAAQPRLRSFHELMPYRVRRILLVSSLYDSFIMSEEGHLQESLLSQFLALNLSQFPDLVQVASVGEAFERLDEDASSFDLVICSIHTGEADATEIARHLLGQGRDVPVIALAYTSRELAQFLAAHDVGVLEQVFLWQGDVRILLAMVKCVEDRRNVENDAGKCGVPLILVVEDNIRYYSSFLPEIYAELFDHAHHLIAEGLNLSQKMLRMRARPKVLLCTTYEQAWELFERFKDEILGLVSDVQFPRGGAVDDRAGVELCERVRALRPDIRLVLQSSVADNRDVAQRIGASFLLKGSPFLLHDLRRVLVERFGFGDFIFRTPDRAEIDRAKDLNQLVEKLATVPAASVAYHATRNHFSNWMKARTEFSIAERLRSVDVGEIADPEELRRRLLAELEEARVELRRSVIADFDRGHFEPSVTFTRIGGGSLGGKARGMAFANRILRDADVHALFPDVDVYVPPSVVLGTNVFEAFLEHPQLRDHAIGDNPDEEIEARFLAAPFPRSAVADLHAFLQRVRYPLAVRSSGLLEDSLSQPFAGVYRTFMLPNNELDSEARWQQLAAAVKRVYASTFSSRAKDYLAMTSYRLEEEKMAVVIQELVGEQHRERFYPDFAGVARSYDFYPQPGQSPEDGVAAVALGMGLTVVQGNTCLRFSPRFPSQAVGLSSVRAALDGSQRSFYALDVSRGGRPSELSELREYPLEAAEDDGLLTWLGSTYCPDDHRIVDGISREGIRLVTFAQVLKHGAFPLAELLRVLLERCTAGMGGPVEIEFAGRLARGGRPARFAFLQMRPLALSREGEQLEIDDVPDERLVCRSSRVLGNGRLEVTDMVVVDREEFDRSRSAEAALAVARFDAILRKERRGYLLVGVGRWGSADPHLGIPVSWNQIGGARAIVEAGFEDLFVEPSQGTHFFQNLSSSGVGYFTVNPDAGDGHLDWAWLASQPAREREGPVRLVRLSAPVVVKMSGKTSEGIVVKP